MWSFGSIELTLQEELEDFRHKCNDVISKLQLHQSHISQNTSNNNTNEQQQIFISEEMQHKFLFAIAKYSSANKASPHFLLHILQKYNFNFLAVFFSMLNISNFEAFQHRFCMLANFFCDGSWSFMDQISFCELINILLSYVNCLSKYLPKEKEIQNARLHQKTQKLMIYHNFIQWLQNLALPANAKLPPSENAKIGHDRHEYKNLDRSRISNFTNLVIFHRYEIFEILIKALDYCRKQQMLHKNETEEEIAFHEYLCKIYFTQFVNSIIPTLISNSPLVYITIIARIYDFGYPEIAQILMLFSIVSENVF